MMNQGSTQAQIQKLLLTQKTFRRNKRYYDASKLINLQHTYEIKRRSPREFYDEQLQCKINKSFQSSKVSLNERLNQDIEKFKGRVSPIKSTAYSTSMSFYNDPQNKSLQGDIQQESTNYSPQKSPRNIRGVPHASITSRDYFYQRQNKPIVDERLFSNFKIEQPDEKHIRDFAKMRGRSMNFQYKHMNDIYHDTQKLYQNNNFKKTTQSCRFNLKLQKAVPRYFFNSRREGSDAATDLNPQKVQKAFECASHFDKFKSNTFYFESGRQLPHQIQLRDMTPQRDYWRGKQRFVVRPKPDYFHRKLKDEMVEKRMKDICNKRENHVDRNEICDQKYFKMLGSSNKNNKDSEQMMGSSMMQKGEEQQ